MLTIPTFPEALCRACGGTTRFESVSAGYWKAPKACPRCGARGDIFLSQRPSCASLERVPSLRAPRGERAELVPDRVPPEEG